MDILESFKIQSILSAIGSFQGFFLIFLILKMEGGNRIANRFLALFILVGSYILLGNFYITSDLWRKYPSIYYFLVLVDCSYLPGPLLYFYTAALTRPGFRFRRIYLLHFMPAIIATLYGLPDYMISREQIQLIFSEILSNGHPVGRPNTADLMIAFGAHIQAWLYIILSLRLLASHRRRLQNLFTSIEHIRLTWLKFLITGLLILYSLILIQFFLNIKSGFNLVSIASCSFAASLEVTFFICAIGYKGLMQREIFSVALNLPDDDSITDAEKSSISPEKIRDIMAKVTQVMNEKKPYLDPDLTLPSLAEMLDVPRNYLSQAINEETKQNFYEFVNLYRVETAKRYLADPEKQNMNILNIAFEAGFNTKATFNSFFKKNTNLTPTEYKKMLQKNQNVFSETGNNEKIADTGLL